MKPLKSDDQKDVAPIVEVSKPVDPQDITYSMDNHSADFDDGKDERVAI